METNCVTIIPAFRISSSAQIEIRLFSVQAEKYELTVLKHNKVVRSFMFKSDDKEKELKVFPDFSGIIGDVVLEFKFYQSNNELIEKKELCYQIINSPYNSTTLIDGCWISIYHWNEDEARWFNKELKKLTDNDWKEQIYAIKQIGINSVIIQNVFHCNEYVGQHDMTMDTYTGQPFYSSAIYPHRYPLAAADPVEAILEAADENGMNVFIGVGNYAWFDFSPESLKWHIEITKELFSLYGHHRSLYGWYISEEIMGSLYYDYPPVKDDKYNDIVNFFCEYKKFVNLLTPTKPIALAPNNIRFHEYENEWGKILVNIDIILPFGFARDPENINIGEIARICKDCGTHFWVDMEMFAWPLDNGLVPKTCDELIKEIRLYDQLEQIYGYQYTGIMNRPEIEKNLGRKDTKELYKGYQEYYKRIISLNK